MAEILTSMVALSPKICHTFRPQFIVPLSRSNVA